VWVVGASSGIGSAMAKEFSRLGANIVISARRGKELDTLVDHVTSLDGRSEGAAAIPFDATELDVAPEVAKAAVEKFGQLDVLCLCQGISNRGKVAETDISVDQKCFNVNFFSYVALAKAVLPFFLGQGSGAFVVISSVQGFFSLPQRAPYSASKQALHGYFDALRAEVDHLNIQVNIVAPGYVRTELSLNALTTSSDCTHGKMDATTDGGYAPDYLARKAVAGVVAKKELIIIAQPKAVAAIWLKRIFPSLLSRTMKNRGAKLDRAGPKS